MRWPLVRVVLGYAAGLLLAEFLRPDPFPLFIALFVAGALALVTSRFRRSMIWMMLVLAGCANLSWRTAMVSPDDLRVKSGLEESLVTVRGTLLETPSDRVWALGEKESWRFAGRLRVSALRGMDGEWEAGSGVILVNTPGHVPEGLFGGQVVEVEGLLVRPRKAAAPGLFDYRKYLARQNIHFLLRPAGVAQWRCVGPAVERPLADRFVGSAQGVLRLGLPEEDEALRLLWAMSLGWKGGVDADFYEPFMLSGTMHVFAISGLHIVLIAGILTGLLLVVRVPRGVAGYVVIPLVWFYTWATGWQASAIRATIMVSVVLLGYGLKRPSELVNSLAAAALLILVWDPQQLFGASFQLSFCVVLALGVLGRPVANWLRGLRFHDELLPEELVPGWKGAAEGLWRRVAAPSLATTVAACAGVLPLTAEYFHVVSPVSLVANVVVVPLSSLALAANLGSLMVGGLWPDLAGLLNHGAWALMRGMIVTSNWAAELPLAYANVTSPPWLFHVGWYGGIALFGWAGARGEVRSPKVGVRGEEENGEGKGVLRGRRRDAAGTRRRGRLRYEGIRWAAVGVCLGIGLVQWSGVVGPARTVVTVLPLEGGPGALVESDGQGVWLFDPGNREPAERLTKPFLRARGVDGLEGLVLSHGDSMHVGGAGELARFFPADRVLTPGVRQRSTVYRRVVGELGKSARVQELSRGERAGPWRVLHPGAGEGWRMADDGALVLAGEFLGTRVLMVSDLGYAGQQALLASGEDLRADVVVAGLPSRGEPLCEGLMEAMGPKVIVLGDKSYKFAPRAEAGLRSRLEGRGVRVFRTEECGVVRVEILRTGIRVRGEGEVRTPK